VNSKWWIPALCLLLLGACGKPDEPSVRENCSNGVDDDGNGLSDCNDPECSTNAVCVSDPPECATQYDCVYVRDGREYDDYIEDPLPMCLEEKCVRPPAQIDVYFQVDTKQWSGIAVTINAISTRFIKKVAPDGSAVTCTRIQEVASSNEQKDADQLEKSKLFNYMAYDVTSVNNAPGGSTVVVPALNASVGSDFIIYTELWSGKKQTNTGLPQGFRIGWGCLESGDEVRELTEADNGRARTIVMPPPQGVK